MNDRTKTPPHHARRKAWTTPLLRRLGAGSAEFGALADLDAEGFS
jgi:hypothetical protein